MYLLGTLGSINRGCGGAGVEGGGTMSMVIVMISVVG